MFRSAFLRIGLEKEAKFTHKTISLLASKSWDPCKEYYHYIMIILDLLVPFRNDGVVIQCKFVLYTKQTRSNHFKLKKKSKTGIFILTPIKVCKSRSYFFTYCMDLREGFIKGLELMLLPFGHDMVVF